MTQSSPPLRASHDADDALDTVEVVFNMCVEYFEVNNITTTDSESSSSSTTDHKPEEGAGLTTTASMRVLSIAVFALTATLSL